MKIFSKTLKIKIFWEEGKVTDNEELISVFCEANLPVKDDSVTIYFSLDNKATTLFFDALKVTISRDINVKKEQAFNRGTKNEVTEEEQNFEKNFKDSEEPKKGVH